mmetsp:Transcript_24435/g.67919  ORF Transcript_24435/g.67919 Transcript_24435/m.67919 type:complete len:270 (+) Transcript_24435:762-1571(+)
MQLHVGAVGDGSIITDPAQLFRQVVEARQRREGNVGRFHGADCVLHLYEADGHAFSILEVFEKLPRGRHSRFILDAIQCHCKKKPLDCRQVVDADCLVERLQDLSALRRQVARNACPRPFQVGPPRTDFLHSLLLLRQLLGEGLFHVFDRELLRKPHLRSREAPLRGVLGGQCLAPERRDPLHDICAVWRGLRLEVSSHIIEVFLFELRELVLRLRALVLELLQPGYCFILHLRALSRWLRPRHRQDHLVLILNNWRRRPCFRRRRRKT